MIRIKFRHDGDLFETALLDDRPDVGPEIRQLKAADCDAGKHMVVDVPGFHCPTCPATGTSMASRLGLSGDDLDKLSRWREVKDMAPDERKMQGLTSKDLGDLLDRVTRALVADHVGDSDECDDEATRIVVEVESTP